MKFLRRWVGKIQSTCEQKIFFHFKLEETKQEPRAYMLISPNNWYFPCILAPRTVLMGMEEKEAKDCSG